MAVEYNQLYNILRIGFPDDEIILVDTAGDSNHYEVTIISDKFKNLPLIAQHRMVNDVVKHQIGHDLHALQIHTKSK